MRDRTRRSEELVALFARAPIKKTFGMELGFNERDESVFDLPHNPGLGCVVLFHNMEVDYIPNG